MKYFLGMQVKQEHGKKFLSQEKYAVDIFMICMVECKPTPTPWVLMRSFQRKMAKRMQIRLYIESLRITNLSY